METVPKVDRVHAHVSKLYEQLKALTSENELLAMNIIDLADENAKLKRTISQQSSDIDNHVYQLKELQLANIQYQAVITCRDGDIQCLTDRVELLSKQLEKAVTRLTTCSCGNAIQLNNSTVASNSGELATTSASNSGELVTAEDRIVSKRRPRSDKGTIRKRRQGQSKSIVKKSASAACADNSVTANTNPDVIDATPIGRRNLIRTHRLTNLLSTERIMELSAAISVVSPMGVRSGAINQVVTAVTGIHPS